MRCKRMERFLSSPGAPNRDVIRQDEYGNFMVVLLTGTIAVDRVQPWGEQLRLAETRPGDILGEMSLLDSGIRFSACTTLTDCEIAVLSADAMDDMMMTRTPSLPPAWWRCWHASCRCACAPSAPG
jgi:CRP/FNR family cyclic AMP-dependent transcriptional regulator